MSFENILGKASKALRDYGTSRRKKRITLLFAQSREYETKLETEARRFGIELRRPKTGNYYEVLGIKHTASSAVIKEAYHGLVKKYHPDVSKDAMAEEQTKKLNEAYAVLRDTKLRAEYDKTAFKAGGYISAEATRCISRELTRIYLEIRARDFEDFRAATSAPMRRDELKAEIENVCDWNRRFNRVAASTFDNFRSCAKRIRKLSATSKKMSKNEKDKAAKVRLSENGAKLGELAAACGKVEKGITVVTKKVKADIGAQERVIASKLRSLV